MSTGIESLSAVLSQAHHPVVGAGEPIYMDRHYPLAHRVDDLLSRLTLEEKIALVHGDSKFTAAGVPRLGIPRRFLSDGPHGVREELKLDVFEPAGRTDDFATYMPALTMLASTWDPQLATAYGTVLGEEARARGKHILLGPGLNIQRTPLNGRTFEYMGEDPFLTGRMAVGYIHGVQSQQVAACAKHFAANNQEQDRFTISAEIDERTLREIYLPAFKAAIHEGGVLTVMGAYNRFRGQFCCHNAYLLNDILKGEWNFQGLVASDWNGAHDTEEAAFNGLDLEMGTENRTYDNYFLGADFLKGIQSGRFPLALLDDKVRRNLRVLLAHFPLEESRPANMNTSVHQATARRVAEEGLVLLKNHRHTLPLNLGTIKNVAVIGENALRLFAPGGGSAGIKAFYEITPLEGIFRRAGRQANISFSMGYHHEGTSTEMIDHALATARAADAVILVAGLNHDGHFDFESLDRNDLTLPYRQDELIQKIAAINPRTIVVLVAGGPVEMDSWLDATPAVLQAWYPGMEGGHAIARVLFGDVNPSGKLPCTFPRRLEDSPAHVFGEYPGTNGKVHYREGLLVGYRYFDTASVEPLFPFGHGLSFTQFTYAGLHITMTGSPEDPHLAVECTVTNAGEREGGEVVQLYVQPINPHVPRPKKELKGFQKLRLSSGESVKVSIHLNRTAFAYYNVEAHRWAVEAGAYAILLGSSSRDIRLEGEIALSHSFLFRD